MGGSSFPSSSAHTLDDRPHETPEKDHLLRQQRSAAPEEEHDTFRQEYHSSMQLSTPHYPPSTPHLNPNNLLILSHQSRGRGVYASRPLPAGTLIEISPVLLFAKEEWENHGSKTILDCYTFKWGRLGQMALALGLGSLFNHSSSPSVSFRLDRPSHSIRYILARDVVAGEELCISYGPWGKQYEGSSSHSDSGDASDYDERKERELADFLKIGEDRSESDDGVSRPKTGGVQRKVVRKTRTRYINGNGTHNGLTPFSSNNNNNNNGSGSDSGVERAASGLIRSGLQSARMANSPGVSSTAKGHFLSPSSTSCTSMRSADAAPSIAVTSAPIWRLSSLPDPATVPLRLLSCYALSIPPRSSSEIMRFIKEHSAFLGRSRLPGSEEDVLRHAKTLMKHPDDGGNLRALLCPAAKVNRDELEQRLRGNSLMDQEEGKCELLCVEVASTPAPIKARAPQWSASWPVALRSMANTTTVAPPLSSPSSQGGTAVTTTNSTSAILSASKPGFIDRKVDSTFWSEARTQWVVNKLARCVVLAQDAKDRGEVPVGVHVCPSILATAFANNAGTASNTAFSTPFSSEQATDCDDGMPDSTTLDQTFHAPAAAAAAAGKAISSLWDGGWDLDGLPLPGGEAIEVDAFDTRRSQKNPIKHAVGNAIQRVAELRAFKRGAAPNGMDQPTTSPHRGRGAEREAASAEMNGTVAHSSADSAAAVTTNAPSHSDLQPVPPSLLASTSLSSSSPARPSSPSLPLLLNGQDYLLTSLTLFTTHEPCVYCCMSLVHSRVRTLIFLQSSPGSGGCCGSQLPEGKRCNDGLQPTSSGNGEEGKVEVEDGQGGPYALQEQRGLNHRFEVWKWRGNRRGIVDEVERLYRDRRRGDQDAEEGVGLEDQREDLATLLDLRRWGNIDP